MKKSWLIIGAVFLTACFSGTTKSEMSTEVVLRSEVQYQPLNPARGDASPRAGVLWGDIKKDVPSGAIIRFEDGFSSPPHIHNITYRGVVISGKVHNDDPGAENQWMGPGSYWTQPAGESHITSAAKGSDATIFLEILEGPYLVKPSDQAFDSGARPVNIDTGNLVWLSASDATAIDRNQNHSLQHGPAISFLWGRTEDSQKNGSLLKLPAGFHGELRSGGPRLRAVVIKGSIKLRLSEDSSDKTLETGSYFATYRDSAQSIACVSPDECLLYASTEGRYRLTPK